MGTDDIFKKRKAAKQARRYDQRRATAGSFLIVSEGAKTEPQYFDELATLVKQHLGGNIEIRIEGEGMSTVTLVEKTAEIVSGSSRIYDIIWVVFDKDDNADFDEAIKLAKSLGFKTAWSNQAFEFWIFLHFNYSDSALHRSQWLEKLDCIFKENGIREKGYQKNLDNLYHLLKEHGDESAAIKSAESLCRRFQEQLPSQSDPCTTVYKLVQQLNSLLDE